MCFLGELTVNDALAEDGHGRRMRAHPIAAGPGCIHCGGAGIDLGSDERHRFGAHRSPEGAKTIGGECRTGRRTATGRAPRFGNARERVTKFFRHRIRRPLEKRINGARAVRGNEVDERRWRRLFLPPVTARERSANERGPDQPSANQLPILCDR